MSRDPVSKWRAGATARDLAPGEAAAVAEHLMQRHPAYRDPKHLDHATLSAEVSELMQRAHPGQLGPNGEVIT